MSNETSSRLTNHSDLYTLVDQFRQRHPMGALVSELLTLHQGEYVVRAVVQIGGTVCCTGMAAAPSIEAAEDRAKERALRQLGLEDSAQKPILGLGTARSLPSTLPSSFATLSAISSPGHPAPASAVPTETTPVEAIATAPAPEDAVSPRPGMSQPDLFQPSVPSIPLEPASTQPHEMLSERSPDLDEPHVEMPELTPALSTTPSEPAPAKKSKPTKAAKSEDAQPEPKPPEPQESQDYSDIIAKIDVEMMRLGWNASKGREHLKSVYGKRSRQQLSYPELLDFLAHLESQTA